MMRLMLGVARVQFYIGGNVTAIKSFMLHRTPKSNMDPS